MLCGRGNATRLGMGSLSTHSIKAPDVVKARLANGSILENYPRSLCPSRRAPYDLLGDNEAMKREWREVTCTKASDGGVAES